MDLVIRNACLADRASDGPLDIGIDKGRIVAIERALAAEAEGYDAGGCLACPGLIETHIHLDKSRIIERCVPQERRTLSPVKGVTPLKKGMSVEDVRARAARTLEHCIMHGTTRMRTQVEVDPGIGMRGFEGVQSLIADYKWAIDIEICVFPQEGLTNYPGTEELVVEGLKRGAKVIGGAPRYDSDEAGQIHRIFELAREYDVDIDIHLDVGPTPDAMNIHLVRELTDKYRRGGRQSAGRTRRELLALLQQHPQSGDPLRRLLANPHGQSLCECSAGRPSGQIARMLRDADRTLGALAQSQGLRFRGRSSGRRCRHQRAIARAGDRRDRAAAGGVQEGPSHDGVASARTVAAAIILEPLAMRRGRRRPGTARGGSLVRSCCHAAHPARHDARQ